MGLKSAGQKPNTYRQQGVHYPVRMKRYMEPKTVKMPTVQSLKYVGSTIDRIGQSSKDVESMVANAWLKWRDLTGVICDKKVPKKIKAPDIPDTDSTDVALRLLNIADVS